MKMKFLRFQRLTPKQEDRTNRWVYTENTLACIYTLKGLGYWGNTQQCLTTLYDPS